MAEQKMEELLAELLRLDSKVRAEIEATDKVSLETANAQWEVLAKIYTLRDGLAESDREGITNG